MILGGVAAIFFGVNAEGKSLEDIATPLSVIGKPPEAIFRTGSDRDGVDPARPGSVPDPRLGEHDDPAYRRRDDGAPPLA
jgi:hypothetical protein